MIGQLIHDKLITDFAALQFEGGNTLLNNVKKFYAASSWESQDGLILPDSTPEQTEGNSAGNTATTREYSFRFLAKEEIEATDVDATGSLKYSRLMNIVDAVLDYLQKEPNNLRAWGNTNSIDIFKIRITSMRYDTLETEGGYSVIAHVSFSVFVNIIPQNL